MTTTEKHVVFGTGPAGSTLAELLHTQGKQVCCVNRSGQAALTGIDVLAGDMLDARYRTKACKYEQGKGFIRITTF